MESIYQPGQSRFCKTHSHVQEKPNRLHIYAKQVDLTISKKKTEVMTLNVQDSAPEKVEDDPLPYTEQFTYLGSTVRLRHEGGARKRHQQQNWKGQECLQDA